MQVIVKGHHIHVSDHLRETTIHKIEKLTRFFDRIDKVDVQFSHEKVPAPAQNRVEVHIATPLGSVRAHAMAADPEVAMDVVIDKLERQVKRMKDKVVRNPKGGIRAKSSPKLADGFAPLAGSTNGTKAAQTFSEGGAGVPFEDLHGRPEVDDEADLEGSDDGPNISRIAHFDAKPITVEEAALELQARGHAFFFFVDAETERATVIYRRKNGSYGLIQPA